MLRPISWYARFRTFLCTFPVCFPLLLFPQRLRRTVLVYLRQALFRFRRLCRLRLPQHVVDKMSVPVESERLAVGMWTVFPRLPRIRQLFAWCLVSLRSTKNCITGRWTLECFRILLAWSMCQCRRSSAICLIFLREDGPGIHDVPAIWTPLFVPLVRCPTRPIRVLFHQKLMQTRLLSRVISQ